MNYFVVELMVCVDSFSVSVMLHEVVVGIGGVDKFVFNSKKSVTEFSVIGSDVVELVAFHLVEMLNNFGGYFEGLLAIFSSV